MRRIAVVVVLCSALTFVGPPVAGAATTADLFPDDGGACTAVPDTLPGIFDFTEACERHDACYAQQVDRLACDLAFREDLIEACQTQHPDALDPRRALCLTFAELYFLGVRFFGGLAFGSA